jgi:polyhydroxybutyrate depolymerase
MRPAVTFLGLASFALACFAVLSACDERKAQPPPVWPEAKATNAGTPEPTSNEPIPASPACGKAPARTGAFPRKTPIFGKNRSYLLAVPTNYDSKLSYPLVYVLHGNGGNGSQVRGVFDLEPIANGHAIFVYPDALGNGWDLDSPAAKNGDVALFDASLAQTQSEYCIDLHRVFIAGFSNGAYMANQLACRRGDRIRAVATHSGGGPYEAGGNGKYDSQGHLACNGKPVASLTVHGTSDPTVVPSEGQKSVDHWSHANHCSESAPVADRIRGCITFQGCANHVMACTVAGLGHSLWAQAKQATWSFFDAEK